MWEYTQSVAGAVLNVWALDDLNYQNFVAHVAYSYEDLSFGIITGDYFIPTSESVWHIIFWNVDSPLERSTTVTAKVEFDEQNPTQNDGNTGGDANAGYWNPTFLDEANFNSSGMLIFQDTTDVYKFYIDENETVTISIKGLNDENCNFYLINPSAEVVTSSENMTSDFEYEFTTTYTYYFMIFNKTFSETYVQREVYYFIIDIHSTNTGTTPTVEIPVKFTTAIFSLFVTSLIISIIIRKKKI